MESKEKILEDKDLTININTYAGTVKAIRDVSFDLNKGETLAIVGESGSGKTVTTRSIMGLNASNADVAKGSIMFHDKDILKMSDKELKPCVVPKSLKFSRSDDFTRPNHEDWRQIAEPLMIHRV